MAIPKKKENKKKKTTTSKKRTKAETGATGKIEERKDNVENDVHLTKHFELYALWKAMPPIIKGVTPKDLEEKYFIDDPMLIELLQLRTQRQFADHFDLCEDTLTRWNNRLKERDLFADIREWSNKLLKNVMMSTYRVAMSKDPKANGDRKLFLQFSGWGEEMTVTQKGESLADIIKRDLKIA